MSDGEGILFVCFPMGGGDLSFWDGALFLSLFLWSGRLSLSLGFCYVCVYGKVCSLSLSLSLPFGDGGLSLSLVGFSFSFSF